MEHILGFCNTFIKVTKNLGFHAALRTNDLQAFGYSALPQTEIINLTFLEILHLFVPNFIPTPDTQL